MPDSADPLESQAATSGGRIFLAILGIGVLVALGWVLRQGLVEPAWVGPRLAVPYAEEVDLGRADRVWAWPEGSLELGLERPVHVLKATAVQVRARRPDGTALRGLEIGMDLNMDMDMGRFHLELPESGVQPGTYQTVLMLPTCVYGGNRWYLRCRVERPGRAGAPMERTFVVDVP